MELRKSNKFGTISKFFGSRNMQPIRWALNFEGIHKNEQQNKLHAGVSGDAFKNDVLGNKLAHFHGGARKQPLASQIVKFWRRKEERRNFSKKF